MVDDGKGKRGVEVRLMEKKRRGACHELGYLVFGA
jgi:hypothetical protein